MLDLPDHARPARDGARMQWGDGFEIETVINCRFAAAGVDIVEVPSVELLRIHGESNLNAVTDGLRVLRTLFSEWRRARSRRIAERPSHRRPRELPVVMERVVPARPRRPDADPRVGHHPGGVPWHREAARPRPAPLGGLDVLGRSGPPTPPSGRPSC